MKLTCAVCDAEHEGLPELAFAAPFYYDVVPEAQRGSRVTLTSDLCQVYDDFFIRGSLEIPHPDTLKLKAAAHVRSHEQRPLIELEPTDHPLPVLQREGIPLETVAKICSQALHPEA